MGWDDDDGVAELLGNAFVADDSAEFERLMRENPEYLRTADGENPFLGYAAQEGRMEFVRLLIELGATANDGYGGPGGAISAAAGEGHLEIVRFLLDHGGQLNDVMAAAIDGHLDIVKLLVERGADVHAAWHGMNALMHAKMYGRTEVAEYLSSLGVKDVRDTTPADYPASHQRLQEIMTEHYGELARWQSQDEGNPTVTVLATKSTKTGEKALFTLGLSDRDIHCGDSSLVVTELMLLLPASERLSKNMWPVEWMRKIARDALDDNSWPDDDAALFMNGDPPEPLAKGTNLCGWLCLRREGGQYQMPDYRWVDFRLLFPIYREEQQLIESKGHEELLRRLDDKNISKQISLTRKNLGK